MSQKSLSSQFCFQINFVITSQRFLVCLAILLAYVISSTHCSFYNSPELIPDPLNEDRLIELDQFLLTSSRAYFKEPTKQCETDSKCPNGICLNGKCVKLCSQVEKLSKPNECLLVHCNSKLKVLFENSTAYLNENGRRFQLDDNVLIQTNNYPLLSKYLAKKKCSWILKSAHKQLNSAINLYIERFSTEFLADFLFVFAGDSIFDPLIASLSGQNLTSFHPFLLNHNESSQNEINFYNTSSLYFLFKSDLTSDFATLNSLSSEVPFKLDKTNDGISINYKFKPGCFESNSTTSSCQPEKAFSKERFNEKNKFIEILNYEKRFQLGSNLRRAFHCSFVYDSFHYVVGGYSFHSNLSFVSRLSLKEKGKWEHFVDQKWSSGSNRSNRQHYSESQSIERPESRYSHSCVLDEKNEQLFMYGGIKYKRIKKSIVSKETTNELWVLNLKSNKWLMLQPSSSSSSSSSSSAPASASSTSRKQNSVKNYALPIAVSGHSMHLIDKNETNKHLLIFFGYSEFYGSTLNLVQEFNLGTKTWRLHNITNINIGFAHSSIHDEENNIIYFHAGLLFNTVINMTSFKSSSLSIFDSFDFGYLREMSAYNQKGFKYANSPLLSPMLYSLDLSMFEWNVLAKSPHASYMQSMSLHNKKLYVYGGVVIDDRLNESRAQKSNNLRIFDTFYNKWLTSEELDSGLSVLPRYAHSSFVFNNTVHIFAGFNGFFLSDLFKFSSENVEKMFRFQRNVQTQNSEANSIDDELYDNKRADIDLIMSHENFYAFDAISKQNALNLNEICAKYANCYSCQIDTNCVWNLNKCEYFESSSGAYRKASCFQMCNEFKSCSNCTLYKNECIWCATHAKCILRNSVHIYYPFGECVEYTSEKSKCAIESSSNKTPINKNERYYATSSDDQLSSITNYCSSTYSNCSSCIQDEKCGWCTNDSNNFLINSVNMTNNYSNMFNFSLNTGYGICMEGGESIASDNRCNMNWFFSSCPSCECNGHSTCSQSLSKINENKLPSVSSYTCGECLNNTEGEYCSVCKKGYYGNAKNNGKCNLCECGSQAEFCDQKTGRCFCNTKGVVGSKCDQCDWPRYTGRPNSTDGTCFYNLTTDYQFTFNLNKESDQFYTRINFVNHPVYGSDDDIDFMVRCFRDTAFINVTFVPNYNQFDDSDIFYENTEDMTEWPFSFLQNISKVWSNASESSSLKGGGSKPFGRISQSEKYHSYGGYNNYNNYYFGSYLNQQSVLTLINCTSTEFKYTFTNKELKFASQHGEAVFVVYVHNFSTPITIQIAFSRRSRVQLLYFFVTFFGCLLTLLTIAFITWKTKQRYDRFRRQRQILIQMQHMASRPFTRILVDVTKNNNKTCSSNYEHANDLLPIEPDYMENLNVQQTSRFKKNSKRKAKQKYNEVANNNNTNPNDVVCNINKSVSKLKIMPVAVEPLSNNKSAVVTCLLKLPQGDLNYTPKGSSPFMLASTYVQMNQSSLITSNFNNNQNNADVIDDEEQNEGIKSGK